MKTNCLLLTIVLAFGYLAPAADPPTADSDKWFNTRMEPFLSELNLTDEQRPKFLAIQKAMTKKWAEFQKLPADERKTVQQSFYIVGVFWCNPVDTPKGFGKPGIKQGFFGDGLAERPGLHEAAKELNAYREERTPERLDQ